MSTQTPRYEYSRAVLQDKIELFSNLNAPFGLTVRYAVKANPFKEIVKMMHRAGLHFDASSSYEATMLLKHGIPGSYISLSSQQRPHNLEYLLEEGVLFVATSLEQLNLYVNAKNRGSTVSVRINPAMGYGHNNRTSTGGIASGFGIWHEYIPDILKITNSVGIIVDRIHIHVGSGADPSVWRGVMKNALKIVDKFPDVTRLDIGGGYKVHRYGDEQEANMEEIMNVFSEELVSYYNKTKRQIKLEIEPGTYLVAHAGKLIAMIDDIVDTGKSGYTFLRINTGMNDFLRTTLYGSQHKIEVLNSNTEMREYVVIGHNCESGDILTCKNGDPEIIEPRLLKKASIGDLICIHDTGAYCASMRSRGYNAFPDAIEVMVE